MNRAFLGVSETSRRPPRSLVAGRISTSGRLRRAGDPLCYRAKTTPAPWRRWHSAATLDTLVFAGGIGENSPDARRRICAGLDFLGIALDERRNEAAAPLISTEEGRVAVRVIRTDEEPMIV